mmetsp:Transcript_750/g.2104  ORF Transcript_750/g.2104 Transcript_750/m.2104 type:complete len:224 (+) Transcript_750:1292-1963(+)
MQPTDHKSTEFVYCFGRSITSGALYHRVTTYSVKTPQASSSAASFSGSSSPPRARPKSQTFSLQSPVSKIFAGFKSRCATPAAWMWAKARRSWHKITCTCLLASGCCDWITLCKSVGMKGRTRNTSSKLGPGTAAKSIRWSKFGCLRRANRWISRNMLLPCFEAWRTCFTATCVPVSVSSQRCTVPYAPRPSCRKERRCVGNSDAGFSRALSFGAPRKTGWGG